MTSSIDLVENSLFCVGLLASPKCPIPSTFEGLLESQQRLSCCCRQYFGIYPNFRFDASFVLIMRTVPGAVSLIHPCGTSAR